MEANEKFGIRKERDEIRCEEDDEEGEFAGKTTGCRD